MVASARLQALTEGSDHLKILSEFLSNPKLIDELSQEVVRLNKLSNEEEKKLHDAQLLVQEHDKLVKEIAAQRKLQADEKAAHDALIAKEKKECDEYVAKEKAEIDKLIKNNKARE